MIVVKYPEKLKKDLTTEGNTITATAIELRYSKAYISSIISGVRNPNAKLAIGICEILKKQFEVYFFIRHVNE